MKSKLFSCLSLPSLLFGAAALSCAAPQTSPSISRFSGPFLFTYGTWEKRAKIEGGKAILRGEGLTSKGGGGANAELNLKDYADRSPLLRVNIGETNTLKTLRLMLRDTDGKTGTFDFPLGDKQGTVLLLPREGASLSSPNSFDKTGPPNLSKIMQWQLQGDWGGDTPVDVIVEEIGILQTDAEVAKARAERAQREAKERAQREQEHAALRARFGKTGPNSPTVERVSLVAPDLVCVEIRSGKVTPGSLAPYQFQEGDTYKETKNPNGSLQQKILIRGGQEVGWLIGPKRNILIAYEKFSGDPLLEEFAENPKQYTLTLQTGGGRAEIVSLARKSKPTDWAQPRGEFAMLHRIYLKTAKPLTPGETYRLTFGSLNVQGKAVTFKHTPETVRSEAVHINQIGFRPDDPAKRAYLSCWLGTGGGLRFPDGLKFRLVNDENAKTVYSGTVEMGFAAETLEKMHRTENFNKTDVLKMDFSNFRTPGRYRVVVDGIGCSYPFDLRETVWDKALLTQLRGLYNERSGMELGPPYTDFKKPRDFHPADGAKIYRSTYNVLTKGAEAWADIAAGSTGELVTNAWGGYHDAGDWNPRRATHLKVTMAQLELVDLFPAKMRGLNLNIPKREITNSKGIKTALPDILTEALWEIDCFRRMQEADGGIPYGIETEGDPIDGEVSWLNSMPAYRLAPDVLASFTYAAAAARIGRLLERDSVTLSRECLDSAARAFAWGDRTLGGKPAKSVRWEASDARNLASLELYRATGDKKYHALFLQETCLKNENASLFVWGDHVQKDAAFAYLLTDPAKTEAALREAAKRGLIAQAESSLTYQSGNAFNLTSPDPGKPMIIGFYSQPDALELVRAHYLTGEAKYLAGAVRACGFSGGANAENIVYTTGLGANPVKHPLHLDSRRTGQPAPAGLTVYGNFDVVGFNQNFATWPMTYFLSKVVIPDVFSWPIPEMFFDIFLDPALTEFTVDNWSPNLYVWGYLAGRK